MLNNCYAVHKTSKNFLYVHSAFVPTLEYHHFVYLLVLRKELKSFISKTEIGEDIICTTNM